MVMLNTAYCKCRKYLGVLLSLPLRISTRNLLLGKEKKLADLYSLRIVLVCETCLVTMGTKQFHKDFTSSRSYKQTWKQSRSLMQYPQVGKQNILSNIIYFYVFQQAFRRHFWQYHNFFFGAYLLFWLILPITWDWIKLGLGDNEPGVIIKPHLIY